MLIAGGSTLVLVVVYCGLLLRCVVTSVVYLTLCLRGGWVWFKLVLLEVSGC